VSERRPDDGEPTPAGEAGAASPEEIREAEALARALDGEADTGAPADALQAAALLRHGTGAELAPDRARAVLDRVLAATPTADEVTPTGAADAADDVARDATTPGLEAADELPRSDTPSARRARILRWAAPAATLAAAAAVLLAFWPAPRPADTALPRPTAALLHLQSRAAQGGAAESALLQNRMRRYRDTLLAALEERYEVRP